MKGSTLQKKKIQIPHVYTIAFILIIVFALLTWIIPSGTYDRVVTETAAGEREVVVPGSYHVVDKVDAEGNDLRQGLMDILMAPTKGIQGACDVVAFVLLIGGTFNIINKTDAITAGMKRVIRRLKGKSALLLPIIFLLFGLGGTSFGMAEECLPFYAILMPIILGMGYDSMTTMLVVYMGACCGYSASTTNPFSVLIAQGIAGVEGNPLVWFRYIQWVIYMAIGITFVMVRAARIKKNPQSSITYQQDQIKRAELLGENYDEETPFTTRQKLVLLVFALGMVTLVYGLLTYGWYMDEISMVFLATGILAGIVGGMKESEMAKYFVDGVCEFGYAAVIIGLARGILVVAEGGMIMDTILNALYNVLVGVPAWLYTTMLNVMYMGLSVLLPSSSGMAALTIPIFAPLTELLEINKEALITAYQYGNNNAAFFAPTNGLLMAALGICGISLPQWWKTIWKVFLVLVVCSWAFAAIAIFL